jgi:superfamily II DNA or RNA helicase
MRLVFDRGTLLLLDAPVGANASGIAGLMWDPRTGAWRAPAWRHPELVNVLARATTPCTDEVRAVPAPRNSWRPIELRPYQEAALCAWELAGRRGVVVLPTGSGKTRLALAAMARTGLATLCLVPTRVLLDQWLREIGTMYEHTVGCLGDGVHELAPITVATYESAYRQMPRIGNRFELLVVDEAHHFGAGIRDEALEMSIAPARLGLTATPVRDGPVATRLQELMGPTVYELAIGDLAGRYLASFDLVTLHLDLTPTERARYESLMSTFHAVRAQFQRIAPEGSWEDFARAAARSSEGRRALASWRQARNLLAFPDGKRAALCALLERHRDVRVLVFTSDNETAYAVAREHLIMPFTCDIGRKEREEALQRFRSGELKALVSSRVLNEGLDVPDADVAVIVGGALGEREHVQRVGRLLRPRQGKRAQVFELVSRRTMEVTQARRRRRGLAARDAAQP